MARAGETNGVRFGPALLVVALLIALRVLGISALMPVLSPYGLTLSSDSFLVGLAFGGYGLTMALMQIPMGALSDRIGRRRTIVLGLLVYVAGNLVAWRATTIEVLIAGRLLEGMGAVSSVALALLTDVAPENRRTVALAVAGIGAGVSFLLGVSLGPIVAAAIEVPGIFLASAVAGVLVLLAVLWALPSDRLVPPAPPADRSIAATLFERRALGADLAGFAMNTTLTATMFALPLLLIGDVGVSDAGYRRLLLISVLIGGVLSIGAARAADRRGAVRQTAIASALAIGVGAAALMLVHGTVALYVAAIVYFAGHGAQSASLPSLVGGLVPQARRGAAMGGYNTWTYLGSFVGGVLGGGLYLHPPALPGVLGVLGVLTAGLLVATAKPRSDASGPAPA